jgi:tRNA (Thr-GGU) A37 N-methylase
MNWQNGALREMRVKPIGIIRTAFEEPTGTPIQPSRAGGAKGTVEVFPECADGLKDLEGFERVWLIYWFDRAREPQLLVTPFLDDRKCGAGARAADHGLEEPGNQCGELHNHPLAAERD